MAQAFKGNLTLELQLERGGTAAIGAGELADLHHHITALGPGVDQLATHGEIVVAFGHRIGISATGLASGNSGIAGWNISRTARVLSNGLTGASPIHLGIAGLGAGVA